MTKDEALKLALETLENNKQMHYSCEDTWYSCPQDEEGCANDSVGDECNCGANEANAEIDKVITVIKEALANVATNDTLKERVDEIQKQRHEANVQKFLGAPQPEQEPVALPCCGYADASAIKWNPHNQVVQCHNCGQIYTTPPQRTWQGLTDEERFEVADISDCFEDVVDAVEAKLKQKNGYAEEKNTRQDDDCKHCVNGCPACDVRRQSNVLS